VLSWEGEVSESNVPLAVQRDSFGYQKWECPPLEEGTRGLVRDSRPRELSAFSELQTVRNGETLYGDYNCENWREYHCKS
jgi:hypothetical protein